MGTLRMPVRSQSPYSRYLLSAFKIFECLTICHTFEYEGWREVIPGKHPETAFFAYYSRELDSKAYLCVRKMKNSGIFKPYAIIDQKTFDAEIQNLRK